MNVSILLTQKFTKGCEENGTRMTRIERIVTDFFAENFDPCHPRAIYPHKKEAAFF